MRAPKINRSAVVRTANRIKWQVESVSVAFKKAWETEKKRMKMSVSVIQVVFLKKDGTIAFRHATRNPELIPVEKQPKKVSEYLGGTALPYFDVDKGEWRSFCVSGIITSDEVDQMFVK